MTLKDKVLNAIKSPRFWGAFLLGQFLAVCITTTNVTTRLMSDEHKMNIPTTQSLGNYLILTLVFTSYTLYQYGFGKYFQVIKERGLFYLALSIFDVEANYFIVKGFANTSFLSAMLINACSTPCVVLLSFLFLKTRYQWTHLLGVFIAVVGLMLLILSDVLTEKDYEGTSPLIGDLYCVIAAVLYAVSNTLEEFFVRKHPNWEILGFLGLFGAIINFSQLMILERQEFDTINWTPGVIGLYSIFTVAMFCLYSFVPVLIGMTNATFYNISLLTSDFYGLIIGLFTFQSQTHPLYPFAFVLVVIGLLIYNMRATSTRSNSAVPIPNESELAVCQKNSSVRDLPKKSSTKTDKTDPSIPSLHQKLSSETNDDSNSQFTRV